MPRQERFDKTSDWQPPFVRAMKLRLASAPRLVLWPSSIRRRKRARTTCAAFSVHRRTFAAWR
eukprot:scaffold237711_cov32-Tisochrysis_lutea.AAC.1